MVRIFPGHCLVLWAGADLQTRQRTLCSSGSRSFEEIRGCTRRSWTCILCFYVASPPTSLNRSVATLRDSMYNTENGDRTTTAS